MKDRKALGLMLAAAREDAGFTQAVLSVKLAYTSPQFVSNIERGASVFPEGKVKPYAKALGLNPRKLLENLYAIKFESARKKHL